MSKQIITNWEHYEPVASKDMAHMHHPAAGSLVDYVLRDAGGHIQTLLIGNLLEVHVEHEAAVARRLAARRAAPQHAILQCVDPVLVNSRHDPAVPLG